MKDDFNKRNQYRKSSSAPNYNAVFADMYALRTMMYRACGNVGVRSSIEDHNKRR